MHKFEYLIKSVFKNDYIFSVFSKIVGLFIGIFLSIVTARFFGAELKGISAIVSNNVSLYAVFLGLGIYQAYPFYRRKEPDIKECYINNISTLFLIYEFVAIMVASIMFICNINIYLAISIILIPVEVYIKQLNYVVLIEHPRRRNVSSIIISCSEIIVVFAFILFYEANVITAITYYVIALIVNLILSFVNLRYNPISIRFDLSRIFEFVKFGFVPMLVYLCMTVNYKLDIQMLNWMGCVSYSDIGIYSVGVVLASKIWLIPDAVKDILLSKLIKGKQEGEVAKVIRINLFICIIAILVFVFVGKKVILIMYGKAFIKTFDIICIMLVGIISMIFYKMVYSYNISIGKRAINLIFLGSSALINIIGNYFLIPVWGIYGAAITSVISYTVCGACFLVYFKRVSGMSFTKILFIQKSDLFIKSFKNK